ncbi:MAG: thioesterase family protein [bacterium]|nr:thioesterase family protein [bacterium]
MAASPPYDLSHFRHSTPIQVRWADLDALGHVNNAKFLTYIEQARITYTDALALWDGSSSRLGLIMARVVLDFKLPMFAQDQVRVLTRVARLGRSSFDIHSLVVRHTPDQTDQITGDSRVTVVVYDYEHNQPTAIPLEWREKLIAYEPAPIDQ